MKSFLATTGSVFKKYIFLLPCILKPFADCRAQSTANDIKWVDLSRVIETDHQTYNYPYGISEIRPLIEGMSIIKGKDKYGVITKEGNVVVPPQYDYIEDFSQGLALVKKSIKVKPGFSANYYGFIDKEGNEVMRCQYKMGTSFFKGLALVKDTTSNWFYIDKQGNSLLEGALNVYNTGHSYGSNTKIDKITGLVVELSNKIPTSKYNLTSFSGTMAFYKELIYGREIIQYNFETKEVLSVDKTKWNNIYSKGARTTLSNNICLVVKKLGQVNWAWQDPKGRETYAYTTIDGKEIFSQKEEYKVLSSYYTSPIFHHYNSFKEGFCIIATTHSLMILNSQGAYNFYLPSVEIERYHTHFSEGLIGVKLNKKGWGFLDSSGRIVVPQIYFSAQPFSQGYSAVRDSTNSLAGFIDRHGNVIYELNYEKVTSFSEGFAWVKKAGKWGLLSLPNVTEEKLLTKVDTLLKQKPLSTFSQLIWLSQPTTVHEPSFTAKAVLVSNTTTPITKEQVRVYLNGQPLSTGQKDIVTKLLQQPQSGRYNWQQTLPLREGENEIVLGLVLPSQPEVRSEPLLVTYRPPEKPNLYVYSIGVPGNGLIYPPTDAEQVGQLLKQQQGRLFNRVQPVFLNSRGKTTATQLRNEMGLLPDMGITPNDVLLLFVSAHGKKLNLRNGQSDFAILPEDYDGRTLTIEENTTLLYKAHILDNVASLNCKKLILFDACHSGEAVLKQGGKARFLDDLRQAQEIIKQTPAGLITLASSSAGQLSWEDPAWQHGAFTKALLDGLSGKADTNGDHYVWVSELFQYLQKTVPTLVQKQKNEPQQPQMYPAVLSEGQDFPIVTY